MRRDGEEIRSTCEKSDDDDERPDKAGQNSLRAVRFEVI